MNIPVDYNNHQLAQNGQQPTTNFAQQQPPANFAQQQPPANFAQQQPPANFANQPQQRFVRLASKKEICKQLRNL
jgi:hypothetical protein